MDLNACNDQWDLQISYVSLLPVLVPLVLSEFLSKQVKGQSKCLILAAPCWMEATWLPAVLGMFKNVPPLWVMVKSLLRDVSALKGLQSFGCSKVLLPNPTRQ